MGNLEVHDSDPREEVSTTELVTDQEPNGLADLGEDSGQDTVSDLEWEVDTRVSPRRHGRSGRGRSRRGRGGRGRDRGGRQRGRGERRGRDKSTLLLATDSEKG